MIRNIVWDFDGTLFDTYPAITKAFQAALNQNGFTAPLDWIESLAKQSLGYCAATLADHFHIDPDSFGQAFHTHYASVLPEDQPPFPGVIEILLAVCTKGGKNLIVTHRGKESMLVLLDAYKMTEYFEGFITHNDGYPKKPDPAAFQALLEKYNLRVTETLAVGDRDIDVLAGSAAGLVTCLFGHPQDDCSADIHIRSFDELSEYLTGYSDIIYKVR